MTPGRPSGLVGPPGSVLQRERPEGLTRPVGVSRCDVQRRERDVYAIAVFVCYRFASSGARDGAPPRAERRRTLSKGKLIATSKWNSTGIKAVHAR